MDESAGNFPATICPQPGFIHVKNCKINKRIPLKTKLVLLKCLCLAAFSIGLGGLAQAQQENGPGSGKHLEKMKQELGLTDEQVSKLQPIFEGMHQDMLKLKDDTTLSKEDKHQQMKALMEKYGSQIDAVLTPDQQAKWKQILEQRQGEMKQKCQQDSNSK